MSKIPQVTIHAILSMMLLLFFSSSTHVYAQGDLRFFGTAIKDDKPLPGASVNVYMDSKPLLQLTTGRNGKFKFIVDLGHQYRITYTAPGCAAMYMTMDLRVPKGKERIYPDYVCEVPFFAQNDPYIRTDMFGKKPFLKVVYDGQKGFHDDPGWNITDELIKNPEEEKRKQQMTREAEERARREAQEKERLRLLEEKKRQEEEESRRRQQATQQQPKPGQQPQQQNANEPEAVRLEREKQEKIRQQEQNKNVKTQYESNLLKMVAENEKQDNLKKFDKLKTEAQGNSAVQALRKDAELKAQAAHLREEQQQQQQQQLMNKQVKDTQVKRMQETAAKIERDNNVARLKPVVQNPKLNYQPSPNIVVTFVDDIFSNTKTTLVSWPGGKKIAYKKVDYWWGGTYYYRNGVEIDEKTYNAELEKYKRS
jgi:hypothetical protein